MSTAVSEVVALSNVRIECTYKDRVVVADPTDRPWQIRSEDDTEDAIAWRVLLVAPDLHERPVVLIEREDAAFLETRMPDPLKSALDGACSGGPLASAVEQQQARDHVAEQKRLIERYQALAEPLEVDSVELFRRAHQCGLLGSLVLFDDTRAGGDPLPVSDSIPVWDVALFKDDGWEAHSFLHAGVSTLYEQRDPLTYPPEQQERKLVLSGVTDKRTNLSEYIPQDLELPTGEPAGPYPLPFVVRAAESKS